MKYVIIGAGAVGATFAGLLTMTGSEVVLVSRGVQAELIQREGIKIGIPGSVLKIDVPTIDGLSSLKLSRDDLIVLAVKSQDSHEVISQTASLPVSVGRDTRNAGDVLPIYCAQNGIRNESIASMYFREVHSISIQMPASHLEFGNVAIMATPSLGVIDLGRFPEGVTQTDVAFASDLLKCGFLVETRVDIMSWKRAKLLINLSNVLEFLFGNDFTDEEELATHKINELARDEGEACFLAGELPWISNATFTSKYRTNIKEAKVEGKGRIGSSMLQGFLRGNRTIEIDFLNGEIVRLGKLYGVPTPVNAVLSWCAKAIATDGSGLGLVSPSYLLQWKTGLADYQNLNDFLRKDTESRGQIE